MSQTTIKMPDVPGGQTVLIKGTVSSTMLSKPIKNDNEINNDDGYSLERYNENRSKRSGGRLLDLQLRPGKVQYEITITNAQVQVADPNNPLMIEKWAQGQCRVSANNPEAGAWFTARSKSPFPPTVYVASEDGQAHKHTLELNQELARDLEVILMLKSFESGPGLYNSVGLESVVVTDPNGISFYEPNAANPLAALGLTVAPQATPAVAPEPTPEPAVAPEPTPAPEPQIVVEEPVPVEEPVQATPAANNNPWQGINLNNA